ncbi:TonB-dependent receptor [Leadbetterella byssophila]|uniref:TonB-dependent receptor n=1 Tax=Leadbetterella byssophila TaxID=316068 RepID=UPI0039A338BF
MKLYRILFLLLPFFSYGQTLDTLKNLNEVVVKATRAHENSGMVYSNVSKTALEKRNLGQDLPFLLNQLPSVVVTSDAGTGIGYTGIRIRGSDPTRINVTLNGIPYNDAESQGVFWVNMPDFSSSVQSIQVQRGVGSSTNGAGAFGASVNVSTLQMNAKPFAEVNVTGGSFGTLKTNFQTSSGLLGSGFVFDARLSKIQSDGYVDRASSDLQSYYLSGGYYFKNNFIRLNHFGGKEVTYQSWYGIPEALAKGDMKGLDEYIERNGYDQSHKEELLASGRRYNYYNYENEVDHYVQSHWQLISSFELSPKWRFNPTLFFTKGDGYYEQFKNRGYFSDYGLNDVIIGGDTLKRTDLIRRKYLDNSFYGGVWSLDYEGNINASFGGGYNEYKGEHFGEVIWAKYFSNGNINHRYYENNSTKKDFNLYAKLYYYLAKNLNAYVDLQYRTVSFDMVGTGDVLQHLDFRNTWHFFNPKVGLTYKPTPQTTYYISYAKGAKEPNRTDFVDTAPNVPKPEKLHDFEGGYKYQKTKFVSEVNLYYMSYKDQLVLTGRINQVGEAIRMNVPNSYRAGIELQATALLSSKISAGANLSLSRNKINSLTYVVPSSDGSPDEVTDLRNTDISFSPNIIGGATLTYKPVTNWELSLLPKYVGKQYLDNTSSEDKKLDAYFVSDLSSSYTWKAATLTLLVNNLFNAKYESNGYTYSYIYGGKVTENFVFPQAGINILVGLKIRF